MAQGTAKETTTPADQAIADIVEMQPHRVTVGLTLPISEGSARPTITLEWTREDTNMPLSELLQRIEGYVARYSGK
ncbi:MAG: hypothetical protein L3K17_00610 [Thermoplasmata archaeon]|nr:hypothetical protein [Thermoplasmata archaeon]